MDSTRFDTQIQRIAKRLAGGDGFLAEELRSEMHIAIMSSTSTNDDECMVTAAAAAKAYLKGRSDYGGRKDAEKTG